MPEFDNNFKKSLDELIEVFKKIKNTSAYKEMVKTDLQLKNIEMLIENYELIRNNIPNEIISEFGGQLKTLIEDLTEKLKKDIPTNENENTTHITDIEAIDKLLSNEKLPEYKINELLDQRNKLKNNESGIKSQFNSH
jgi:hypothetical protein